MKVRNIVADQSSAEHDQLRRSYNALLLVLENVMGHTFTTLADLQSALANTLSTGTDSDFTTSPSADSYVGTGAELVGLRPTPKHPSRAGMAAGTSLVTGSADDAK